MRVRSACSLVLLAFAGCASAPAPAPHWIPDESDEPVPRHVEPRPTEVVVYLHGRGAALTAGSDDPARFTSAIVRDRGLREVEVPAFEGSADDWNAITSCARTYFDRLPVRLVEEAPPDDDHLLVVVGGTAAALDDTAWGRAPGTTGTVLRRGVAFVYSASHADHKNQRVCETIAHEIGHMLGADHTDDCTDLMVSGAGCAWSPSHGFVTTRPAIERALATRLAWSPSSAGTRDRSF